MANIAKTYTFVNGQPADATQVNKNFDDIIAGVGDISAAGHALIDDASADAQLTTLGVTAAAKTILDDATVGAILATIGGVATGDARLSNARPASDVYAWAKAATRGITTGTVTTQINTPVVVTHGLGVTPSYVGLTLTAYDTAHFAVTARDATTFTVFSANTTTLLWIAVA